MSATVKCHLESLSDAAMVAQPLSSLMASSPRGLYSTLLLQKFWVWGKGFGIRVSGASIDADFQDRVSGVHGRGSSFEGGGLRVEG